MHGVGGLQDHTHDLAEGLRRTGHEVEVIAGRHPEGLADDVVDGVPWHFVDARPHHLDDGWLKGSRRTFADLHRDKPFHMVHSESSGALGLVRAGVHHTLPVVVMFHGNYLTHVQGSLRRAAAARRPRPVLAEAKGVLWLSVRDHFRKGNAYRFRACEAIVPSADQVGNTLRSHMLARSRVHVVPNGIDADVFRPRPDAKNALDLGPEPLFVCVGRLSRGKGVEYALQALAQLEDGMQAARLVVVGDGEDEHRLRATARELGLSSRVIFVGKQTPEGVASYLAAADGFLFPTTHAEAAPLVLLQAMAAGAPVIASGLGAIPEVVERPGENALLVPPHDSRALATAMTTLLRDASLRTRLAAGARRRVLAEFTLERMTERTLDVYRIATERHAARQRQ